MLAGIDQKPPDQNWQHQETIPDDYLWKKEPLEKQQKEKSACGCNQIEQPQLGFRPAGGKRHFSHRRIRLAVCPGGSQQIDKGQHAKGDKDQYRAPVQLTCLDDVGVNGQCDTAQHGIV